MSDESKTTAISGSQSIAETSESCSKSSTMTSTIMIQGNHLLRGSPTTLPHPERDNEICGKNKLTVTNKGLLGLPARMSTSKRDTGDGADDGGDQRQAHGPNVSLCTPKLAAEVRPCGQQVDCTMTTSSSSVSKQLEQQQSQLKLLEQDSSSNSSTKMITKPPLARAPQRRASVFSHNGFPGAQLLSKPPSDSGSQLNQSTPQTGSISATKELSQELIKPDVGCAQQQQVGLKPRCPMRSDTLGSTGSSRASSCDEPIIATLVSSSTSSSSSSVVTAQANVGRKISTDAMASSSSSLDSVGIGWQQTEISAQQMQEPDVDYASTETTKSSTTTTNAANTMPTVAAQQSPQAPSSSPSTGAQMEAPFESLKLKLKRNSMPNAQLVSAHIDNLISENEAIMDNCNFVCIRSYNSSSSSRINSEYQQAKANVSSKQTVSPSIAQPASLIGGLKRQCDREGPTQEAAATASIFASDLSRQQRPVARPRKRWSTSSTSGLTVPCSVAAAATMTATASSRQQPQVGRVLGDEQFDWRQQQQLAKANERNPTSIRQRAERKRSCTNQSPISGRLSRSGTLAGGQTLAEQAANSLLPMAGEQLPPGQQHQQRHKQHQQPPVWLSPNSSANQTCSSMPNSPKRTLATSGSMFDMHAFGPSQDPAQLESAIQNLSLKRRDDEKQQLFANPILTTAAPTTATTTNDTNDQNHITTSFINPDIHQHHPQQHQLQRQQSLISLSQQQAHEQDNVMTVLIMERHRQSLIEHQMRLENQAAILRCQQQQHQQQQQMIEQQLDQLRLSQLAVSQLTGNSSGDNRHHEYHHNHPQRDPLIERSSICQQHRMLEQPQLSAFLATDLESLGGLQLASGASFAPPMPALESQLLSDFLSKVVALPTASLTPTATAEGQQHSEQLAGEQRQLIEHGAELLTQSLDSATPSHRCDTCDISFWTKDLLNYHLMTQCAARGATNQPARPVAFNFIGPNNFEQQHQQQHQLQQQQLQSLSLSKSVSPPREAMNSAKLPITPFIISKQLQQQSQLQENVAKADLSSLLKQQLLNEAASAAKPYESLPFKKRKISEPNMKY